MRYFTTTAIAFCTATAVYAGDARIGNIKIDDAWARTGQAGQVSAAYMEIENKGAADKLLAAHCDCAKATELHIMSMTDGTMKMAKVPAMEVPANGELKLKPGGYHIMLIGLTRPLVTDEKLPLKLTFEKAGEITVDARIKGMSAGH